MVGSHPFRSVSREFHGNRRTVLNILEIAGQKAAAFLDAKIRNVKATQIQADELASYVRCRQHLAKGDDTRGAFYTFLSVARESKLIVNFKTDKHTKLVSLDFLNDLKSRMAERFQLSTDGWAGFCGSTGSVRQVFGDSIDYATEIKRYFRESPKLNTRTYQLARFNCLRVASVRKTPRIGLPDMRLATTSHCERTNLTMRHFTKRFHRLTLGYSKTLENHRHAVALFVFYFNCVRRHGTLGKTPAETAGILEKPMSIADLLNWNENQP